MSRMIKLTEFIVMFGVCLFGESHLSTKAEEVDATPDVAIVSYSTDSFDGIANLGNKKENQDVFGYHPLTYDTASLYVHNYLDIKVSVWGQSDECYKCKLMPLPHVQIMATELFHMDTRWPLRITIKSNHNESITYCQKHTHFGELGNYSLYLSLNSSDNFGSDVVCELVVNEEPRDSNIPVYIALAVYIGLTILYTLIEIGYKRYREGWFNRIPCCNTTDHLINNDLGSLLSEPHTSDKNSINNNNKNGNPNRLKSLDAFRGMAITGMIFGGSGGGAYWYFEHAKWNGITPADFVFPCFIYIMGVSMVISFQVLVRRKTSNRKMLYKITRRTIWLFALGCLVDGGNDILNFRIPGVLQRFSISYFVVACLQLISLKSLEQQSSRIMNKYYAPFCDILDYWYEWIVMACIFALYSCLTHFLPVPGCPTGYLGPGGPLVGENGELANCTGGAANYIDRWILGSNHITKHSTPQHIYKTTQLHDPEGILGAITSILLTFFGLQAGKILLVYRQRHSQILMRFLLWGVVLGGLGTLLCKASRDEGWVPINKNLWSVSFILVTGGCGYILLAICYFTIDVKKWWSGAPFYFPGMNAILLYVGHIILFKSYFPFSWKPIYGTHAEFLLMAIVGPTLWVVIAYWLYTIEMFVKV